MRHLPNLITALRFVLIPVLVALLIEHRYVEAFAGFVVSALSDLADGQIARRWNLRTRLGAIADPLADKLTMLAVRWSWPRRRWFRRGWRLPSSCGTS